MCALKSGRDERLSRDDAETIALRALAFLAGEERQLQRFRALSGVDASTLMAEADTAPIQAAVLDHLLQDESLLMVFAGHAGLKPQSVGLARALLADGRLEEQS